MKKVLFGTTALVLSAGLAHAKAHNEVTIGVDGASDIWISDSGVDGEDPQINTDIDIIFSGVGETDGGLGFGFDYAIQNADDDNDVQKDNAEVFINGGWGELRAGDTDNALQMVAGLSDIGFDGVGVDNRAEVARGSGEASGVLYSGTFGSVSVHLGHSMDLGNDDISAGVSVDAGPVKVGLGYISDDDDDNDVMAVDLSGDFSGVSFDIYYEDSDSNDENYGIILGYEMGRTSVNLGYADGDDANGDSAVGVGFGYDLGGNASIAGGVGDVAGNTVWDFGIAMAF